MQMQSLVRRRMDKLLRSLAAAADTARGQAGIEEVHQLRVATRRLSQNLKTFRRFWDKDTVQKLRKRLRGLRDIAADLRSRDIALTQWEAAKLPPSDAFAEELRRGRERATRQLTAELARWKRKGYPDTWRAVLDTRGKS